MGLPNCSRSHRVLHGRVEAGLADANRLTGDGDAAAGHDDAGGDVPERVAELAGRNRRVEDDGFAASQVGSAFRADVQQQHHRRRAEGVESDGVAATDTHGRAP